MEYIKKSLKECDELMYKLVQAEEIRQREKLNLNAAMSLSSASILEIQGSIFDNIDAEGYIPNYIKEQTLEELDNINRQLRLYNEYKDDRFNKCCEYANIAEALAQKRLAKAFANEKAQELFVNVQLPTGAIANYATYNALVNEGETILSLGINDGGHTTHGDKSYSASQKYNFINYHVSIEKNNIDYEEIAELLDKNKPRMIIMGASSFPLQIEWEKVKSLIKQHSPKTLLMADIAHTAGLVAGGAFNSPIGIADVTTLVTYKTFCGPRAGVIITSNEEISKKIDEEVFPKLMGSPLLLNICAIAVSAKVASTKEYKKMQHQIITNANILCDELIKLGISVAFGKTESHIVLINCEEYGNGRKMADILEDCNILVNACKVPTVNGYSEGIRIGTTIITQEDYNVEQIKEIANVIYEIFKCTKEKCKIDYDAIKSRICKLKS